ncbi:ATPase, partial [Achromatium sp. WMS3]
KLRDETRDAMKEAYKWLSISILKQGNRSLRQAAFGTVPMLSVSILPKRSLGVEYPSITSERLPLKPVGLLGTDVSFDRTREKMADAVAMLARLGELEMALNRLMEEQRKAQKRVNALKYNIIPRYRRTIRFIRAALEEEERNTLFQIKILREQSEA